MNKAFIKKSKIKFIQERDSCLEKKEKPYHLPFTYTTPRAEKRTKEACQNNDTKKESQQVFTNFYSCFFSNLSLFGEKIKKSKEKIKDLGSLFEIIKKTPSDRIKQKGLWKRFRSLFKKKPKRKENKESECKYEKIMSLILDDQRSNISSSKQYRYNGLNNQEIKVFESFLRNKSEHLCSFCEYEKLFIKRLFQIDVMNKVDMLVKKSIIMLNGEFRRSLKQKKDDFDFKKIVSENDKNIHNQMHSAKSVQVNRIRNKENKKFSNIKQNVKKLFQSHFHKNKKILLKKSIIGSNSGVFQSHSNQSSTNQNQIKTISKLFSKHINSNNENIIVQKNYFETQSTRDQTTYQSNLPQIKNMNDKIGKKAYLLKGDFMSITSTKNILKESSTITFNTPKTVNQLRSRFKPLARPVQIQTYKENILKKIENKSSKVNPPSDHPKNKMADLFINPSNYLFSLNNYNHIYSTANYKVNNVVGYLNKPYFSAKHALQKKKKKSKKFFRSKKTKLPKVSKEKQFFMQKVNKKQKKACTQLFKTTTSNFKIRKY